MKTPRLRPLIILCFAAFIITACGEAPEMTAAELVACKADLSCWSKHHKTRASIACYDALNNAIGRESYEMTIIPWQLATSDTGDLTSGNIVYHAPQLQLTAGQQTRGKCLYDPSTEKVALLNVEGVFADQVWIDRMTPNGN